MARVNVTSTGTGGSGAVASVAGRTGAVVLTAADVGAGQLPSGVLLPSGVVIPSGADISGVLGATSATAAAGNDSRLSDARTPTAHKTSHATGGSDVLTAADVGATTAAAALTAAKGVSLDQFVTPAADVPWNSKKITGLANGSGAQDAAAFGQIPTATGAASGLAKIARRSSASGNVNSGTTGTTLTSDDTLLLAVGASDVWFVQAYLLVNAANATMDFKVGWVGPTGAVFNWGALSVPASAVISWGPTATGTAGGAIKTLAQSLSVDTTGAGIVQGMSFAGIYVGDGSHAGNLNLQWAQNTADVGNLNLQANSFLMGWRLA